MKFLKMVSLFLFQSSNIFFHSLSTGVKAWGQFVDKKAEAHLVWQTARTQAGQTDS